MYRLFFANVVKKQQKKIPKKDLEKIKNLVLTLGNEPRPLQCKKLVGGQGEYRIRYRNWRILYTIDDHKKEIIIYGILDRKEVYK